MKNINLCSAVKGTWQVFIFVALVLFLPLVAQGIDVPCLSTQYSLTISVTPPEGGTVSPIGTNCYGSGQVVSLTATPNSGYFLYSWYGDLAGSQNPTSITMDSNKHVTAYFQEKDGNIDTTFNSPNGFVTYSGAIGSAIALQPDAKIVVVGEKYSSGVLLVLRYNNDGTLDTTFGTGGIVTYETASDGTAVAIQPDGKIVVVGSTSLGFAVLRYNSDGKLDPTFGINGIVTYGGLSIPIVNGVALQPDGKIVVVGNYLMRLNTDGTLDNSFGTNGLVTFGGGDRVVLQKDGKIIVGGGQLLRFNDDGTLDNTFGANGVATCPGGSNGIALQEDEKIIVVTPTSIERCKSEGVLDTSFGNNGVIVYETPVCLYYGPNSGLNCTVYNDVALQGDGKIVAVGKVLPEDHSAFVINRYNSDGSTDNTFQQITGCVSAECHQGLPLEEANSVTIQPDGKIIIVDNSSDGNIFIVRYIVIGEQQFELISIPNKPSGPSTGNVMENYAFSVGGSSSSLNHSIEYRFDWGDGTYSNWSSSGSATKSWPTPGTYSVKAQARCAVHQTFRSDWSEPLAVNILAVETVSTPNVLYGPTNGTTGTSYTYFTGGSSSNFRHPIQYLFDWGDSTNSGWLTVGTTSASHSWNTAGIYSVKVQARCATDTNVISSWSNSLTVNIGPITQSCTVTTNPSGLQIIIDGTTYTGLQAFNWTPGSSHTLSVSSPQSGTAGTRYVYSSWSDGGTQTHTLTVPSSGTAYTATFSIQYQLTITSSPPAAGTVMPVPMGDQSGIACPALVGVICAGYYSSGTLVTLTATPNTVHTFSGWSGDLSGTANPASITMNGAKNVVANFTELIGPDLTGSWTTPVTQTCKNTRKGPKCTIKGVLTINNNGNRDASSSTVKFYLSDNNTYDQGDTPLSSANTGKIKSKQSKAINLTKSFRLDQDVKGMYIIAVIDKYNSVKEIDETNKIVVFGPIQ